MEEYEIIEVKRYELNKQYKIKKERIYWNVYSTFTRTLLASEQTCEMVRFSMFDYHYQRLHSVSIAYKYQVKWRHSAGVFFTAYVRRFQRNGNFFPRVSPLKRIYGTKRSCVSIFSTYFRINRVNSYVDRKTIVLSHIK